MSAEPEALIQSPQATASESGTPPSDRSFRPDVQGMRAIAVLLTLLFHANIPGFSGGYVGIDIFFVISGFVITGLLLRERRSTGHTSLRSFYGRRIRRITPMATVVIIVAIFGAYVFVGPLVGNTTATDGRWAAVFLANFHFQQIGTNYLSSVGPPSPLLNYWSLAVEEQFYIVYPALFILVGWWATKRTKWAFRTKFTIVLSVIIAASYSYSIVLTGSNAQSAYFSVLVRSWDLALGALIALYGNELQRVPRNVAAAASWIGLAAILVTATLFGANTPYPGALVAFPTLATGLMIAAGASTPTWGVERLLRCSPFQFIGDISYSLYLWHWPILVLAAQNRGVETLPTWENLLLLIGSVLLATLTYRFVENPVRHSRSLASGKWTTFALGAFLIASSLVVATVGLQQHQSGALAVPGLADLQTADSCPSPSAQAITQLLGQNTEPTHRKTERIMLLGDSTACTMLPGLAAVAAPAGVQIENAAVIGCGVVSGDIAPMYVNGRNVNQKTQSCQGKANAAEAQALKSGHPSVVIWSSSWERSSLVVSQGSHQEIVAAGSRQWYSVLTKRMDTRVRALTSHGSTVVLVTQAPFAGEGKVTRPTASDESFLRLNQFLRSFATRTPHVRLVDLSSFICPSGPPCPLVVDGIWVRGDGAHFTGEGSLWAARWLLPQIGVDALRHTDTALPVMRLVLPSNGQIVRGSQDLVAAAPFNLGVTRVEFSVTGENRHETTLAKAIYEHNLWTYDWHTKGISDGTYVLRSIAFNSSGDRSVSKAVTVRVSN